METETKNDLDPTAENEFRFRIKRKNKLKQEKD